MATTFLGVGWRPIVSAIGRVFMAAGTLMLLFVVYELWGTGINEARSQTHLTHQFKAAQQAAPKTPDYNPPPPPTGAAIANIRIPDIGVDKTVVEGVGVGDLKQGPGHYPDTPMPGQAGNAGERRSRVFPRRAWERGVSGLLVPARGKRIVNSASNSA